MEVKTKKEVGVKWESVKLGEVATFVNGYAFKPSDWSTEGLEIIRIQNLTRSTSESNYYSGSIPEKYKITKGDILISWSATLDIFIWDGNDAWLNQHIFKVVFDKIEIDKNYFIYAIKNILDDMRKQVHGATMQHITKGKFDNLLIPLPPLATQQRIAAILDAADALRRKDQELLRKYDELAQAIFIDMFGDPVKNEKGWEVKTIGESIDFITSGSRGWAQYYSETGDLFLRINNVGHNEIKLTDLIYVKAPNNAEAKRTLVEEGDVLLSITADLGRTCVIPAELPRAYINQHLAILRLKKQFEPNYVSQVFATEYGKNQFKKLNKGGVKAGLNFDDIKSLEFINPPLELQKRYSLALTQLKNQEKKVVLGFEKNNHLFHSLLHQAFNGELVA
jgi:type I restriction enzyme S subunit